MADIRGLIQQLWADYNSLNPQARAIHDLLESRGERVINDHIALRTYDDPRVNLDALAARFVEGGYQERGHYVFPEKKLLARHFEHLDGSLPKIFISELKVAELSSGAQRLVHGLVEQAPVDLSRRAEFPVSGRVWELGFADYEALRAESEYAAWLAAWGFRANHFTVLVNRLASFKSLRELNAFLKENGFKLNSSGGEIKGSPQVYLEQSSTLADDGPVRFRDGTHLVPACYYEFAQRYVMEDGKLYEGFVEKSADKIFESTDKQ